MIKGQQPAAQSGLPFRKKILYYGLMLLLILLVIEGMARLAYYAAYGQGYGRGAAAGTVDYTTLPEPGSAEELEHWRISHPFYGYTYPSPANPLNAMPPQQRWEGTVFIGLLGGSVAKGVNPFFQHALNRYFAANGLTQQPLVIDLTGEGMKQPQQTLIVANTLLLGGDLDLIVNLDGFNEITVSVPQSIYAGLAPSFPIWWERRAGLTKEEILLAGNIAVLRREQSRLAAAQENSPLRGSALFGLANRYRQERTAAEIIRLNHALTAVATGYSLEKHGPRNWLGAERELRQETGRVWYRSSVALSRLAKLAGADYYHFLQPNQYVPGSKPLSPKELELAYAPSSLKKTSVEQGYPILNGFSRDFHSQGINYFDLTGIFVDNPETLYLDPCCHLNDRGNELLAAEMVRLMEPALRQRGGVSPVAPVAALAAARRPAEPPARPVAPGFQVSLQEDGKYLRYVREGCAPGDADPVFFLHIIPEEVSDLPLPRKGYGFDQQDFRFAEAGGSFWLGQCTAQIRLPDYPIAALRTGQVVPGQGDLWAVELIAPADPDKLRADYAALSDMEPAAQDYFDLYAQDNRLIYLRETCAAADTAARFSLYVFPEDATDLPKEWRSDGYAYWDFAFASRGGPFDGKCLAAVPLPDYPIAAIRTGQYVPGQGNLWSVELITPAAPDKLRAIYAALSDKEPVARNYFDLYILGHQLIYLRESCTVEDTAPPFFLPVFPEDPADLPADRRDVYFNHWGFNFAHGGFEFARQGGHFDGKCLASVPLPDYPIAALRTGQHIPGQGDVWSVDLVAAADPEELRADYAALSEVEPAARDYFDLYRRGNRLLYLRESCTDQDTAAVFFLYVFPEDLTDLPEEWQSDGNAYLGFNFVRWGGHFDGKCLAAVPLPDYPIKKIRTGQYVPGQGDVWSVVVAAP